MCWMSCRSAMNLSLSFSPSRTMVENSAQDQPIKIVVIATLPLFIDWFLMEQIQAMKSVGYDVTVVCSGTDGIERLREHGFRVVPVMIPRSIQPLVLLKALLALVGLFRRCLLYTSDAADE